MANVAMETLRNYTIGFDSLFKELEAITDQLNRGGDKYPPHGIAKIDEDNFKLRLAVAGFAKEDLQLTVEDGLVAIKGHRDTKDRSENLYNSNYHGIAERDFLKKFQLSDYMEVVGSELVNGILTISIQREVPKEKQPKTITIN